MLPLDTDAALGSNFITQESISVNATTFKNGGLIFLKNAPFFGKDLSIKYVDARGLVRDLIKDKDYILVAQWYGIQQSLGGIWGAIYLVDKSLNGNCVVDYRALGGNLAIEQNSFVVLFSSLTASWMIGRTILAVSPIMKMSSFDFKQLSAYQVQYGSVLLSVEISFAQTSNTPTDVPATQEQMALDVAKQALALAQTALQALPIASTTTIGCVKQGPGININSDGTISTVVEFQGNTENYVASINGRKGDVEINIGDVRGLGTSSVYPVDYFATAAQGALAQTALQVAPVTSVNGLVGQIELTADHIVGLGGAARSDVASFATALDGVIARSAYQKPSDGIPITDLSTTIADSLAKADRSLQIAPVVSVNGKTGVIILRGSDIDGIGDAAFKASSYFATAEQGTKADTAYQKPEYGIRFDDLSNEIQIAFSLASSAMQSLPSADNAALGGIQLTGDLGGTAIAPTVPGLADKQTTLVSTINIKTVGNKSLLGAGDLELIPSDIGAATAAQGVKADTALQTVGWQDIQNSPIDRADLRAYIVSVITETLISNGLIPPA